MSTFLELQDETIDICQDLLTFPDFNREKVKYYLNKGEKEFARLTRILQKKSTITTVADQTSYTVLDANNVYMIEHVRYVEDSNNEYGWILPPFPGGYANLPKEKSFGHPRYYWFRYIQTSTTAEIGTVPIASAGSETIEYYHSYLPADMSLDADLPDIRPSFHSAISEYAVWKLHEIYAHKNRGFREKAGVHKENFINYVIEATTTAKKGISGLTSRVINAYGRRYG